MPRNENNAPTVVPPEDSPKPVSKAPRAAKLSTVTEHCKRLFPARRGRQHVDLWQHASAAALHQWALYAHHMAGEMRLSEDDYSAALKAAQTLDAAGVPTPHGPALFDVEKKGK